MVPRTVSIPLVPALGVPSPGSCFLLLLRNVVAVPVNHSCFTAQCESFVVGWVSWGPVFHWSTPAGWSIAWFPPESPILT